MANDVLRLVVSLSVQGTVAGLLVMALRQLMGRRLPVELRYILWAAVFIKLLVPVNISSGLSVFNLFNYYEGTSQWVNGTSGVALTRGEDAPGGAPRVTIVPNAVAVNEAATENTAMDEALTGNVPIAENVTGGSSADSLPTGAVPPHGGLRGNLALLSGSDAIPAAVLTLLVTGSILSLLGTLTQYRRKRAGLYQQRQRDIDADRRLAQARLFLSEAGVDGRHRADILFTDAAKMPYVFGFIKPVIVLPAGLEDINIIRAAVYHEASHVCLAHHRVAFLLMLLRCANWFNPAVYLFIRAVGADMETDCDNRVLMLKDASGQTRMARADYLNALIHVASPRDTSGMPVAAFAESRLRKRVKHILEGQHMRTYIWIISGALAVALGVILLTGAEPAEIKTALQTAAQETQSESPESVKPYDSEVKQIPFESEQATATVNTPFSEPLEEVSLMDYSDETVQSVQSDQLVETAYLADMTDINRLEISAAVCALRFVQTEDNEARAEFTCGVSERFKNYTLTLDTVDGNTLQCTLEYHSENDLPSFNVSDNKSTLTLYLPEKVYESLSVNASVSDVTLEGFAAEDVSFYGSASGYKLYGNVFGSLAINASASGVEARGNICRNFTGYFSASSLNANFAAHDFDLDLTASASSIALRYEKPVTDAAIDIHSAVGDLTCPNTWKNAPGAIFSENFVSTHDLDVTLGEGSHLLRINASATTLALSEGIS